MNKKERSIYDNIKDPAEKSFCDNCEREKKTEKIILENESGTANFCEDCIKNNPEIKIIGNCFNCGKPKEESEASFCDKCFKNGEHLK